MAKRRLTVRKKKYTCIDGPMSGHQLRLSDPFTMVFTIGGKTGRYIESGTNQLEWESK